MAKPSSSTTGGPTCVYTNCDKTNTTCVYTCARSDPFLSPPPPPPSTNAVNSSSNNAVAPYLIATVCFLGISFLLLTTCTIILRYRFSRRQTLPRDPQQQQPPRHHHAGGDHPVWHVTTTVGLQQSVIDSITTFKYKKVDGVLIDGCDCSVCLTEFIDGDDLRLLPKCCHAFHLVCIDTWLRSHRNCPLCRAPVANDDPGAGPGGEGEFRGGNNEEEINDIESGSNEGYVSDHGSNCHLRETGENEEWDQLYRRSEITCSYRVKIAQILKRNRELGICSDLGVKYRFRDGGGDVEPIRRSYSFNCSTGDGICRGLSSDLSLVGNVEGCSSNSGSSENKGEKIDAEKIDKWSTSTVYGLIWKSSSSGRSLQKGPVSMKRSFSSGGKLFSFRRTKTNSSILPL